MATRLYTRVNHPLKYLETKALRGSIPRQSEKPFRGNGNCCFSTDSKNKSLVLAEKVTTRLARVVRPAYIEKTCSIFGYNYL